MRKFLLSLAITLCALGASAQGIKHDFDKTIIYADSLNLPSNTILENVVKMLPDLLSRADESLIDAYDIQIGDMTVDGAKDDALTQLRLSDIDRIEINESPVASYQNSAVSGTINIFLRKPKPDEKNQKVWGDASLDVGFALDVLPKFSIGYQKEGKFRMRAIAFGEIYRDVTNVSYQTVENGAYNAYNTKEKEHYGNNLARLYMTWTPNKKDEFRFNLSEVYVRDKVTVTEDGVVGAQIETGNNIALRAQAKYIHTFSPKTSLTAEVQYAYIPTEYEKVVTTDNTAAKNRLDKTKTHNVSGKVEGKTIFVKNDKRYTDLVVGVNGNANMKHDTDEAIYSYAGDVDKYHDRSFTAYVNSSNNFGKFRVKALLELQYYHYDFDVTGSEVYDKTRVDVTGKLMTEYRFTPLHNLRFIYDRRITRPSDVQIFPEVDHSRDKGGVVNNVLGNPDLDNTITHEIALDYIGGVLLEHGVEHTLQYEAGLSYYHVTDPIAMKNSESDPTKKQYFNDGHANSVVAKLMARYTYKKFSLTATGNIYHTYQHDTEGQHHYRYSNWSVFPALTLPHGWQTSLRYMLYGKVIGDEKSWDANHSISFNVGKQIKRVNLHVYGRVPLSGKMTVMGEGENSGDYTAETFMYSDFTMGFGATYRF